MRGQDKVKAGFETVWRSADLLKQFLERQDKSGSESIPTSKPQDGTEPISPPNDGIGDIVAFVGKGVESKGSISCNGTVRVEGVHEGEIHTDGILLVGEEAIIKAKITAGTIVSKGKIIGDVIAKERVKLRTPAVFDGCLNTRMLSIEDGVIFNGALEMSKGARELPQGTVLHTPGPMPASTRKAG
ncbi:bactofilin family protein [Petrachloros mirabilis]